MVSIKLRRGLVLLALSGVVLLLGAGPAPSPEPSAAERERLVAISAGLRCLVCEGQSLHGSPTALAVELRREVRLLIEQGKSNQEIVDILVTRYSELLLYEEPYGAARWWFWCGVVAALALAAIGIRLYLGRKARPLFTEDLPHKRFPFRLR